MPAFAPVLRPEVGNTATPAAEVVAAAGEEVEVELDDCEEDVVVDLEEELIELEALDKVVLGMEELVVGIMAVGGFEVVLLVVGFTELVVGGGGVGVVVVVVVVVGEGVLVSTVPKVNPGKTLMDSPVAAGSTTWLPRVAGPWKATFRLLSSVGQ